MARASAGVTLICALAAVRRSTGSTATPPTKPLRVIVFMTLSPPFRYSVPDCLVGCAHDCRRLPRAVARRQDRRRFDLRPIEPHDEVDVAVRRRQPIGFLLSARR